jgi:hypothetical protein
MSEDGKFLSIDQLEEKFNISKNIMKFNSIISAVKHAGKVLFIHSGEDKKYSHVKFSSLSIKVFQAWNTSFQNLFFTTISFIRNISPLIN